MEQSIEQIVEQMLNEQIDMKTFLSLLSFNQELINELNDILPKDAVNNRNHEIWKQISYDALKKVNFNIWNEIKRIAHFDDSLDDNLNIFAVIKIFYCYSHPNFKPLAKYSERFQFMLDVVRECYGGPEVDNLIETIISRYLLITPKTRRVREAKECLTSTFHISDRKYPHWVQGAEWPMGKLSPMKFIGTKKSEEYKIFIFQDVDSDEIREIIQYY